MAVDGHEEGAVDVLAKPISLQGAVVMAGEATGGPSLLTSGSDLRNTGVRDATGEVAPWGTGYFHHIPCSPIDLVNLATPPDLIAGDAIYGGMLGPDFGHVITQSIGRLWAVEHAPQGAPLLFAPSVGSFAEVPQYFCRLLSLLKVPAPPILLRRPARVERLWMAQDICNLDHNPVTLPQFHEWLQRRLPPARVDPALSVYISRSKLGPFRPQFIEELRLEAALADEGYCIIHPERLSITKQTKLYRSAARLLFADGSAMHLWSLFSSPGQKAGVILRRSKSPPMRRWFRSFNEPPLQRFDSLLASFVRPSGIDYKVAAVLDMRSLWESLRHHGFHASKRPLGRPVDEMIDWLAAAGAAQDPLGTVPFELDPVSEALLRDRTRLLERPL